MSSNLTYPVYLNQLASSINTYHAIVSAAIGVPFNLISLFIFARLSMRNKTNMGLLGILQSLVDLSILIILLFVYRSAPLIFTTFPFNRDIGQCKFFFYLRRVILHVSSWIPVVSTFDRFTFVLYGHDNRLKFMKNKWALGGCLFLLLVAICIVNIPNLLYYLVNGNCTANFDAIISTDIISILVRTYIPFALMIIFNVFMIRKLFGTQRQTFRQNSLSRKEHQFTVAVIAYDVYFFILNVPLSIYYIVFDINLYSGAIASDPLLAAAYNMVLTVNGNLSFVVQTLTFLMYLAFNKLFRAELLRVLGLSRLFRAQVDQTTASLTASKL